MAHRHAVMAAYALHWAMMDREDDGFSLPKRYDFASRLRARPLLDEQKFAAGEVLFRRAERHRQLQRKYQIAVEVLVQAVVVPGPVFEHERRRPLLPRLVALIEIGAERG